MIINLVPLYAEFFQHIVRLQKHYHLLKQRFYHRTVIVTAAVHQGFNPQLVLSLRIGVTGNINLLALGRCHPLYFIFRFCRELCFC